MKVNISGTIGKDKRADSGLDEIGDKMRADELARYVVVGIVEYHGYHRLKGKPESLTVAFAAIEPLFGEDDHAARLMLDKARRARGVGPTELTLFDDPGADADAAANTGPWPGDADFKPAESGPGRAPAARKAAAKGGESE